MTEAYMQLENFENAVNKLKTALEYDIEEMDIALDAVIQRFEFIVEDINIRKNSMSSTAILKRINQVS